MKHNKLLFIILFGTTLLFSSCEEFLTVESTSRLSEKAYQKKVQSDPSVISASLDAIFSWLVDFNVLGLPAADAESIHDQFSYMAAMLAMDYNGEDMAMLGSHWFTYDYEFDNRMQNYRRPRVLWSTFYTTIAKSNEILSLIPKDAANADLKVYRAQALALRGMSYYYLINLFQNPFSANGIEKSKPGIPILYASTEGKEDKLGRNTVADVLVQIESDLLEAVAGLQGWSRASKMQLNHEVAQGFLARYYLLVRKYPEAEKAAVAAQKGFAVMEKEEWLQGFMSLASNEWMWGFDHNSETNSSFASFFSMVSNFAGGYSGGGFNTCAIDARLYSQIADTDIRKQAFNGPDGDASQKIKGAQQAYANLKFGDDKAWTMDYMYMRVSEMVLIEAEALAGQLKLAEAATALKKLMSKRDESWNKVSVTVEDIWLQRRIELWGEGFSYIDRKRFYKGIDRTYEGTNHRNDALRVIPAGDARWTYQIPLAEIQENQELKESDQNN